MIAESFPQFVPHPLLRSGHLQTIVGAYAPINPLTTPCTPRVVALDDGDGIVLHDDCPPGWRAGRRAALLLHGVTGCHRSPYMVRLAGKLTAAGVRTFRMDMRGFGEGFKLARHPGHAGRSEDAAAALRAIAHWCPRSPVTLVGFSMGGNIALKLLGEVGGRPPGGLDSAAAVAPPIELATCCRQIERGLNRLYSRSFVRGLVRQVRRRRHYSPGLLKIPLRPLPRRLIEFDNRFTAPLSGFRDADDYYRQASAAGVLDRVQLPALIIAAGDDPMIPVDIFRRARLSSSTELRISRHGGHVGYIGTGQSDPDRWWVDWRLVQWVSQLGGDR